MKVQMRMESKIGPVYLVASELGLVGVFWDQRNVPMVDEQTPILREAIRQISEFLDGKRKTFDLPLDQGGTPFQMRVWAELAKIPYGETRSYREIALALGDVKACRAVGTANGRNPLSLIVPCHRVIAADGTMGGYAGGLDVKAKLLELERSVGR